MPCWGVLPRGLQLVERERAVRAGQLLDRGQRHERFLHCVPCGDVQREQRVDCVKRVLSVPCGDVLPYRLQLVERERVVWCGQLLDFGQRNQLVVHCLPRRQVLS